MDGDDERGRTIGYDNSGSKHSQNKSIKKNRPFCDKIPSVECPWRIYASGLLNLGACNDECSYANNGLVDGQEALQSNLLGVF